VHEYNHDRPHQSIGDATPAERFTVTAPRPAIGVVVSERAARPGQQWVTRKVAANGVVCVDWQQVSVGLHHAGSRCDVLVSAELFQFWIGDKLLKTVQRNRSDPVRKTGAKNGRSTV
jgi:hypothetical protein